MMQRRLLGRTLTFCLVLSTLGSCRISAAPKDEPGGPAARPSLAAVEPPVDASRSKWVHENWKLQKTALANAGLTAVRLDSWQPRSPPHPSTPLPSFGPETECKLVADLPGAPPRLLFNPRGQFVVAADGKVHCLGVDYQSLGLKTEKVAGAPRNCSGGAYQAAQVDYHLYVIPEGVPVGDLLTVRVPYYDLDIRYEEQCPMVPGARF